MKRTACLFAAALVCAPALLHAAADVVIVGAPVYTMDPANPRAEAVVLEGGRVVAAPTRADAMARAGEGTHVIELSGASCVLPGLIDAHGHVYGLGRTLMQVDLLGTASASACAKRVREWAAKAPAGSWVEGRGWDQNDWEVKQFPTWRDLAGTDDHPVYLRRVDGHAVWVNRAALERAGVTRDTPDPEGGRIVRDGGGDPTGVFVDNAVDLIAAFIPPADDALVERRVRAAVEHCVRHGLVSVHDAGVDEDVLAVYERLAHAGELDMHVYCMLSPTDRAYFARELAMGPRSVADGRVVVRSVKLYADGALGSRGAALLAPYDDDPGNTGLLVDNPDTLAAIARRAYAAGFQVCTHAIGDRGNRVALDVYERVLGAGGDADARFRIEHAQVVAPEDFARFHALGVIPSMQPTHATSDMYWAEDRVGPERIKGAYAWRTFLDGGNILPLGSDFPVEDVNPLWGIYAAVTRQDHDGWPEGGWYPGQRLTREEAVRGFTAWAAFAGFAEDERGVLREGMRADIVVLDHDVFTAPARDLLATGVLYTFVDGDIVYDAARD